MPLLEIDSTPLQRQCLLKQWRILVVTSSTQSDFKFLAKKKYDKDLTNF